MAKRPALIKKQNSMHTAFTRFMFIVAFLVLWIGGIGARLVYLQVNRHEEYLAKALSQRRDIVKEKQLRGTIFDRSGRTLAMSVKAKSLYADPNEIADVEKTSKELAKLLKVKNTDIAKPLKEAKDKGKRFVWLARKLDDKTADDVEKAFEARDAKDKYAGLHWRDEQKRTYPYQTLAAHVLGFSNSEDVGSAGIEQSQEEALHGAVVGGWRDRDRLGRVYDEEEVEEREPPKDVTLTISNSIQYKAEQALSEGVKNANAKSGMAIVLDPKTGEILALANYPTFDPNRYNQFAAENYANHAIHDIYSPGSVFKLVTYGAALDENQIKWDDSVDTSKGYIEVAGRRFTDHHAAPSMTYAQALAVSSNVAAIRTGIGVGKENFYGYAQKFGFGQPTGVELPAEANGILRSPKSWQGDSLASMSIGYEIGVSALQMATAFATIANDGLRIQPHIIKEIRQADGKIFSVTDLRKTQVVSSETARGLRKMLRQVVLTGTGKRAQLNGYTSAGKTGTAWKYNPKLKKVDSGKYISSFIGMAPAENPSVVIAVILDEPQGGARDGGQVSAPIFREIAQQILPELNVLPDGGNLPETLTAEQVPSETVDVPSDIKALSTADEAADLPPKKPQAEKNGKNTGGERKTPGDKPALKEKIAAAPDRKTKYPGDVTKNKT